MEDFLQPLAEELHARGLTRLIISPTPPLDLLPLHAVPVTIDGVGHALCEVFDEVTYMPTVRMLAATSDPPASASTSPLIVAHSGGVPGFPHIGGPALEAANLRALYPDARIITEHDAVPRTVLTAMTGSRTVHIASHAYTPSDRWANGLVLQGEKAQPGSTQRRRHPCRRRPLRRRPRGAQRMPNRQPPIRSPRHPDPPRAGSRFPGSRRTRRHLDVLGDQRPDRSRVRNAAPRIDGPRRPAWKGLSEGNRLPASRGLAWASVSRRFHTPRRNATRPSEIYMA